jgi:hypothetical protein
VTQGVRRELERRAQAADRTISREIARALRQYLARDEEEERHGT